VDDSAQDGVAALNKKFVLMPDYCPPNFTSIYMFFAREN
jgi:hypothetical protein